MSRYLKPTKVFLLLLFSALFSSTSLSSQELYWVNGSGSWSDSTHWSQESGGQGGAGIPGPNVDVHFDQHSFGSPGQTVKIKGQASCHDLNWKVDKPQTTLKSGSFIFNRWTGAELNIHGSFVANNNIKNDFYGELILAKGEGERTVDIPFRLHSDVLIDGGSGKVTLRSNLNTEGNVRVQSGSFIARDRQISCDAFIGKGSDPRTVDLKDSKIEVNAWDFSSAQNLDMPSSDYSLAFREGFNQNNFKSASGLDYDNIETVGQKAGLSFSATINDALCNDTATGSIKVDVSGGTLPFDYEIFEGATTDENEREEEALSVDSRTYTFTDLSGGTYMIRITESTGSNPKTTARTEDVGPEPFLIDTVRNLKALSCYNSMDAWFDVVATGGTRPYSYSWQWKRQFEDPWTTLGSDSIEKDIGRGFIKVTVDDYNGCGPATQDIYFETDGTEEYQDSIPPKIEIDTAALTSTDACEAEDDGTVSVTASGGTGDIDYYLVAESTMDTIPSGDFDEDGDFTGLAPDTYQTWAIDSEGCRQQGPDAVVGTIPATSITSQPSDETVCEGNTASFVVSAEGGGNITYQWQSNASGSWQDLSNGGDISGATSDVLSISNTTNVDEGDYRVIVSSECGSDKTSDPATLTVNDATQINTQPSDQAVCETNDVTFSLEADGTNLSYQWQSNASGSWQDLSDGGDISGATTDSLTISNTDATDEADYRALVSGECGDETSDEVTLTVNTNTQITTQPGDQTVCEGSNASFTVGADGTNLGYQWQSDVSGSWQDMTNGGDISGATTDQLTISNTTNSDEADYRVVVSGDCGGDQTSDPASLTVHDTTRIISQPSDQTVCETNDVTFSLDADGNNLSYQWQSNAGGSWQDLSDGGDISGATTDQLTIDNTEEADEADYRAVVSGTCGDKTTNTVSLTVNPSTDITSQPSDQNVCEGTNVTFSVGADGSSLSYQWQSNADGSWQDLSDGGDISGATTDQLTIDNTEEADEADYRVQVNGDCGSDTSNTATLTVNANTEITDQPNDQTLCEGSNVTFSVEADGSSLSYQWQTNAGGSWQDLSDGGDISGATSDQLTIANAEEADEADYRVLINGDCGSEASNAATLTVNLNTEITSQPSDQTVCEGNDVNFSVNANGTNLSYQWQSNISGSWQDISDGGDISGTSTDTLTIASAENADEADYRVVVTGDCGADQTSDPASLTVNDATRIISQPSDQSVCQGNTVTFGLNAEGSNLSYQWQSNAGGSWQDLSDGGDISGATTDSLTISNTEQADQADYRVQVSGDCGDQTSNEVRLRVNPNTQITDQPSDQTVCEGTQPVFEITAQGTNLSFQWQSDVSGSWQDLSDGGDISGATSERLTLDDASNGDEAAYRVIVSGDCGPDQTSDQATLAVTDTTTITASPTDQTICEGNDAVLNVSAEGANLAYQWQKQSSGSWQDLSDGGNISGATTDELDISDAVLTDAGTYRVVVTGDCGMKTSDTANLTVNPATNVVSQPSDKHVCEETQVTFGIEAEGSGSLDYQWQSDASGSWQDLSDETNISGATTDSLTLSAIDTTLEGQYRCLVSGACGSDTSAAATLNVNWFRINVGQPSPFNVDTSSTKITVSIEIIDHEWVQDLSYYLVAPDGNKVRLGAASENCFINKKATDLTFTTALSDTFDVCNDPLSGTYGIPGSLAPMHGSDPANGAWKVRVEDSHNWAPNTYVGEIINASIHFTDQHDVEGDTVTVSYEADSIHKPIREFSGVSGDDPAITEYNVPTGLKTSCYGTCDAIAVVSHQGGIAPYQYEWSDSANFNNIISTNDTTSLCAGTYYIRVTDDLGCTEIDSVVVSQPEEIVIDSLDVISITDKNGCYGAPIGEVHDSAYGGTGTLQYTLIRDPMGDVDTIGVNTSGDFVNLAGGDYFLEVRDDNNCVEDTIFTLEQPDSLAIVNESFTPLSAEGASDGSITIDAQGGTPPLSYVLYRMQPSDTVALDTTSNGVFDNLSEGSYFVRVTDVNGCGPVQSSDFLITPLEIDFDITPVSCAADSNGRIIANINGGLPPLRYEWTSLAGDTLQVTETNQTSDTLEPLAGGRYVLNLIDSTGNSERDTAMVAEPDTLEIANIIPDTLSSVSASDASITVLGTGGNDTIYFDLAQVNNPSFSARDTVLSVRDSASARFDSLAAGLYEVTVYDEKGCGYDVDSVNITNFELTMDKYDILCHGETNGLAIANISGGTAPLTYTWTSATHTGDHRRDSLKSLAAGKYEVTVEDAYGFTLTDSVTIEQPDPIDLSVTTSQAQCPDSHMPVEGDDVGAIYLDAVGGVPYSNPDASYHYYWREIGDTIAGRDSLVGLSGGQYRVSVIDSNGCSLEREITVPQNPDNVISVSYGGHQNGDSICYGSDISLYVTELEQADSLYWETTSQQYTTLPQLDTINQTQRADETYTLRAKNNTCILVDSVDVPLYPRVNITINEGDEVGDDQISVKENVSVKPISATAANPSVAESYLWQPEEFFSPSDQLESELSVESIRAQDVAQQRIQIVAETRNCTEIDTAMVRLIPNVEPSNAFSPNGDGTNDEWYIRYAEQYQNIEVAVFNRWGVEIYRRKPYRNEEGWDGRTANGEPLPSGTYYYIINTHESGIAPLSGTVTIIR